MEKLDRVLLVGCINRSKLKTMITRMNRVIDIINSTKDDIRSYFTVGTYAKPIMAYAMLDIVEKYGYNSLKVYTDKNSNMYITNEEMNYGYTLGKVEEDAGSMSKHNAYIEPLHVDEVKSRKAILELVSYKKKYNRYIDTFPFYLKQMMMEASLLGDIFDNNRTLNFPKIKKASYIFPLICLLVYKNNNSCTVSIGRINNKCYLEVSITDSSKKIIITPVDNKRSFIVSSNNM